jgi:hypothetical protein
MKEDKIYCPNGNPAVGSVILGVVGENDQVEFLPEEELVDKEFMDIVIHDTDLLKKFRFSHPCVEGKCGHWQGSRCNVPDVAFAMMQEKMIADNKLPECSIRPQCRWFTQEGPKACFACPYMVNYKREGEPDSREQPIG